MRKIIVSNMVSLDGYLEGPGRELDWHIIDDDFVKYAEDMLQNADTILFGRVTYNMMALYWPHAEDSLMASKMNSLPKIVFSKTLETAGWQNSTLFNEIIKEEILNLKAEPGKDILILGSGSLVQAFAQLDLVDEYRFIIAPVILGDGRPQFTAGSIDKKLLKLSGVQQFGSGVVMLTYQPKQ